ncbi:hypothetical protein EYR40_007351 [Pleurotus pulmonarius]|nr:hypothetical protein EYR40_007351 [Pleurotus pulmonarius]
MSSTQLSRAHNPTTADEIEGKEKGAVSSDGGVLVLESTEPEEQALSRARKLVVLGVLCLAQFFDVFIGNAVVVSLPSVTWGGPALYSQCPPMDPLSVHAHIRVFHADRGESIGYLPPEADILSRFPLHRDIQHPSGHQRAPHNGAAMNVPSAIAMIRTTCPDPVERSAAYAAYALAGTVGNVSGFVIGGVLTARTSWRWIHFLIAIMVIPAAGAAWFLLPTHMMPAKSQRRGIDIPGVVLLTSGLILFVYAISDGAEAGWGSPQVVTTLVLSVIVVASFFVTEKFTKNPALPSKTWTNKNFTPLFFYAWSPYWWCLSSQLQLVNVFMNLWHDSPLIAAVRCIPIGVAGGIASFLAGRYAPRLNPKHMLVCSQALMALGSVLFALAGGEKAEARYWSYIFPGMVIGMFGLAGAYVGCTTMVMGGAREGEEGVVGAVMYTAYQVGATLGFAIVTSITEGVNTGRQADSASLFAGYAASFWSMVAMPVVMLFIALLFVRP